MVLVSVGEMTVIIIEMFSVDHKMDTAIYLYPGTPTRLSLEVWFVLIMEDSKYQLSMMTVRYIYFLIKKLQVPMQLHSLDVHMP